MDSNVRICRGIYFWDFLQTGNRFEYYLKLQDKRLTEMYEDGIIVLLIHSTKPRSLFKKSVRTIELWKSKKEGMARLIELEATEKSNRDIQQSVVKPAQSESINFALRPTNNSLILHRFKKGQPLPKFSFDKTKDAEMFLAEINKATERFINENIELWQKINR